MTGMDFYIRPRQDFSLSRMAGCIALLSYCGFHPVMRVLNKDMRPVIVIRIEAAGDRKQLIEKAIKTLTEMEYFDMNDFSIIEQSPAEVAVTEVS